MASERLPHVDARIPFPRRSQRKPPRPGRKPQPEREKCVCFLSTCVTESEMDDFETLRLMEPFPPSRSTLVRFLIKAAVLRFRDGFPETFVSAWAASGLPQWWGPEASSDAPVYAARGTECGPAAARSAVADPAQRG